MRSVPLWIVVVMLLPACGGSSSALPVNPPADPQIDFDLGADGNWHADPVAREIEDASNNGIGYTGDIHRFELTAPAAGRLVIELTWEGESDLDFILASDPQGEVRLLESTAIDFDPEYESLPVADEQVIFIFIAGWRGDAADYTLTSTVYPSADPEFALVEMPEFKAAVPSNQSLHFRFNVALVPDQELDGKLFILKEGISAEGAWCIHGDTLVFHPRLPTFPGDEGGLVVGASYQLAIRRAAHGVQAVTGERLIEGATITFPVGPARAVDPDLVPRALAVSPDPTTTSFRNGETITFRFNTPVDPLTVLPLLVERAPDGSERQIPFSFVIAQMEPCDEDTRVHLALSPEEPLMPGRTLRIELPGTARAVGTAPTAPGLTGPEPALPGAGFAVTFAIE